MGFDPSEPRDKDGKWIAAGGSVGPIFHGGKKKLEAIDPSQLQARDSGLYGTGFYTTTSKEFAKSYGPRVSEMQLRPHATVLNAGLTPEEAPRDLVAQVKGHALASGLPAATARGKVDALRAEVEDITKSPLNWKNAVDRFATDYGFDAVKFSSGEVVVKNPNAVMFGKAKKK